MRLILKQFLLSVVSCSVLAAPALSFEFKKPKSNQYQSKDIKFLQRISKGVSELSQQSSKAIVFISISKIIKSRPYGQVDPFEFSSVLRDAETNIDKKDSPKNANNKQVLALVF